VIIMVGSQIDEAPSIRHTNRPFSSARGAGGVLLVWGDDYCDGFLGVEIFSKKATQEVIELPKLVQCFR